MWFGVSSKAEQLETEISEAITSGISVTDEQQAKLERAQKEAENAVNEFEKIRKKKYGAT